MFAWGMWWQFAIIHMNHLFVVGVYQLIEFNRPSRGKIHLLALPWIVNLLGIVSPAQGGDFGVRFEPGVVVPVTEPQSLLFETGGGETIKLMFGLGRHIDLGPSVSYVGLPPSTSPEEFGTAWSFGGGLRLKRPHDNSMDASALRAMSPWVDVDALYVRTGDLNRPGFAAGIGVAIPLGRSRNFWLGPFARYTQIVDPEDVDFDDRDARLLNIGLSLEVGSGIHRAPEIELVEADAITRDVVSCPDRDMDTIPDTIDHCPDVKGVMENYGCPYYDKIIVKRDKLELKEKLYFAWDEAVLEDSSYVVLDEVVRALQDNKGFRVQVEGHASSEGADDHNQTLSEERAATVLNYLVSHGVSRDRLVSKGFSSSVPVDTNTTVEGRENNRRVEFVVNFIILDGGNSP